MCLLFDPSSETRMKKGIERLAGIELYNSLMKFGQSVDVMSDKRYFSYTYKHFWDQIKHFWDQPSVYTPISRDANPCA